MRMIDLRSDTVTQPTPEMRQAMFDAIVGDDVYGDDPTVNKFEALAAEMLGKESAMFVPSGTMGNQVSVMTHTRRGDEIILSDASHIAVHEGGGAAALSQVMLRPLHYDNVLPEPEKIRAAIREHGNVHYPRTGLICVENPLAVGNVVPLETLKEIYDIAKEHKIPVHMDGARIFNAAEALGVEASEIAKYCDSVNVCISKGLCAPVGSVVAGSREFIEEARRNRKILGGGMRQCGVLAAAGIIAFEKMSKRLGEDHANAKYMAEKLSKIDGVTLDMSSVEINMVFFKLDRPADVINTLPDKMLAENILINGIEDGEFRFVTHNDISKQDIDTAIEVFAKIIG